MRQSKRVGGQLASRYASLPDIAQRTRGEVPPAPLARPQESGPRCPRAGSNMRCVGVSTAPGIHSVQHGREGATCHTGAPLFGHAAEGGQTGRHHAASAPGST
eukprot:1811991-Rhodomonas_salina.1